MSDRADRDPQSPAQRQTELSDLEDTRDDSVRGGATLEPCLRKGTIVPCVRTIIPCVRTIIPCVRT